MAIKIQKSEAEHLNQQERKHLLVLQEITARTEARLQELKENEMVYMDYLIEFNALRFAIRYIQTVTNNQSLSFQNKKQKTENRKLKKQLEREKERSRFRF